MTERRSFSALLCIAVTLLAASCKEKDGAAASSGAAAAASGAAPTGKRAAADVCKLLSAADVRAILGEKVEPKDVPRGTRKSLYPLITVLEDTPGAGGIEGAKTGAKAATGGTPAPLTVSGASGFVVTGQLMGSTSTQGAVAKNGLIVSVTVAGGEKAGNEKVVADILKLTLAKL